MQKVILLLIVGIFMMPLFSVAANELDLSRAFHIESGKTVEPKAIALTKNDNFIIAGSVDGRAWASAVDNSGKVKWRYVSPVYKKFSKKLPVGQRVYSYNSAAVMPDDSVFLCGNALFLKKGTGILTHIDKDGNVLSEQLLYPKSDEKNGGNFYSCAGWDGGLVVIGSTSLYTSSDNVQAGHHRFKQNNFYWITAFDSSGKIKWEKIEPVSDNSVQLSAYGVPLQSMADGGFIFAVQDSYNTKVVKVNSKGDFVMQKSFDGVFMLGYNLNNSRDVQLISHGTNPLIKITLNSALEETGRLTENHTDGKIDISYILPDNSLLLLGSLKKGNSQYAWMMRTDSNLKNEQSVNIAPEGDSYSVGAAVPVGSDATQFASVCGVIKPLEAGEVNTKGRFLGAAVDFIKISK